MCVCVCVFLCAPFKGLGEGREGGRSYLGAGPIVVAVKELIGRPCSFERWRGGGEEREERGEEGGIITTALYLYVRNIYMHGERGGKGERSIRIDWHWMGRGSQ